MKAVARLIWSYFMGTPVLRAFTIGGSILLAIDFYLLTSQPQPQSGEKLWLAMFGLALFFVGSSLMPVMFGRLARSHSIRVLPGGRVKLLVSAFLTILLVALPAGILSPASFINGNSSLPEIMQDPRARDYVLQLAAISLTSAVLFAGWIYLALWFVTSQRDIVGLIGVVVIGLIILAPARDLRDLTVSLTWNLWEIAIVWTVFAVGFLLWPSLRAARARRNRERFGAVIQALSRGTTGREFDLMMGTSNPWQLLVGLIAPLLLAPRFVRDVPEVWLLCLTVLSVVAGAFSGQSASRSRALWLRGQWSRAALFTAVERSVWRHNGILLGILMLFGASIGGYARFSPTVMMAGLPLLVLGTVLSTYLGLMITRGLRWLEILSAIGVMSLLMFLAIYVAQDDFQFTTVFSLEVGLAGIAIALRSIARRRWTQIDWMMCRADRAMAARGA